MPAQAKKIVILAGDVLFLYLALLATVYLRYGEVSNFASSNYTTAQFFYIHIQAFTPLMLVWLVVFYIHNLYEITSAKNTLEFYSALSRSLIINFFIAVLFFYFANFTNVAPKTNLFIYFAVFSAGFVFWRSQINGILRKRLFTKTVILSEGESGEKLALRLNQNPQIGYRIEKIVESSSDLKNLAEFVKNNHIKSIIADGKFLSMDFFTLSLNDFIGSIEIISLDKFNERVWRKVNLKNINQLWFLSNLAGGRKPIYGFVKRLADFAISVFLIPFVLPIGFLISACVKICDMGPVFYKQTRVGYKGRNFTLIKFRTMRTDAESLGVQWTVQNDKRVTAVGKFLRKTRLDELPQIINILKGEMSFVGPRAERPEFHQLLVKEIPFYDRRYLVKPGLTGWAQINYTYGSSVEDTKEKLSYDFYYIKNRSFIFDLGIILKTVNIVLAGLGR